MSVYVAAHVLKMVRGMALPCLAILLPRPHPVISRVVEEKQVNVCQQSLPPIVVVGMVEWPDATHLFSYCQGSRKLHEESKNLSLLVKLHRKQRRTMIV